MNQGVILRVLDVSEGKTIIIKRYKTSHHPFDDANLSYILPGVGTCPPVLGLKIGFGFRSGLGLHDVRLVYSESPSHSPKPMDGDLPHSAN